MRILLLALFCVLAFAAEAQTMPDIGPTQIPFYTGNLSVDSFMRYYGTRKELPTPQVTPESIAQLKRISCFAVCDYLSWPLTEKEPGHWDFSLYQDNAAKLNAAGIKYNVFCWLHFAPKWYLDDPGYVPYRCLEHNEPVQEMSLWAPATHTIYERFYTQLAAALKDRIAFIRLAMPSEYGEIGYPIGMTAWLVPQKHVHTGYWCGDRYAREAFRSDAIKRYGSVQAINRAWGTAFARREDITFPPVDSESVARCLQPGQAKARRRWLDFQDWYNQSWADFMIWSAGVVRKAFPAFEHPAGFDLRTRREIIASLGYGMEQPAVGNDQGRYVAAMKQCGLAAQTPGDISYFATRRVSSACALYKVPYFTEPPGDVNRDREVQRIWMDASNGSEVYFDYPQNLDRARDLFAEYKQHLTGKRSLTDFALLLPTSTHWLHPDWPWPPHLYSFSEAVRERLDYEVLDERMIQDGGLGRFGIRMLALADAEYLQNKTLRALETWVNRGGVLISLQSGPVRSIDGTDMIWKAMAPAIAPDSYPPGASYPSAEALWKERAKRVGRGYVVIWPGGQAQVREQADVAAQLHDDLAVFVPGARNGRRVDDRADGVLATLFRDRILYYNPGATAVTKAVTLRAEDFGGDVGRPDRLTFTLELAPHSIASVPLR